MREDINRIWSRRFLCGTAAVAGLVFIITATGFFLPAHAADDQALLRADYLPGDITQLSLEAEETANESLNAIAAIPADERTFNNTAVAFDSVITDYDDAMEPLILMGDLSPDPEISAEGMNALTSYNIYFPDIYRRQDLYDVLVSVNDSVPSTPVEQRLYRIIIDKFEHNGLGLPEENLSRVSEMSAELSALETEYNYNLNNDNSTIVFTKEELEGLSDDDLSSFTQTPGGDYIVTTGWGDYGRVMKNAVRGDTRMRMYEAYKNIQAVNNTALLEEAIVLREEIAKEMGYQTWADYVISENMAGNTSNVMNFLNSLKEPLYEKTGEERDELLAIKQETDPSATEIKSWDISYYENILIKREYNFDSEEFKEYFPADNVINGVLDTCGKLFGVEFLELDDAPVWSPDVRVFEVTNTTDNRTLGYLYLDLFSRDGKYSWYAASQVRTGREINGTYSLPVAVIMGDYDPPGDDKPALFSIGEISDMFHEMGHTMNSILTTSPYGTLSGYNTPIDFVETPSQTLEEWAYDPEVLISMSGRYDNLSEKVPEELARQAIASREAGIGYDYSSELFFSLVDMYYHNATGPVNTSKVWHDTLEDVLGVDEPEGLHPAANLAHIMSGYDAGLYSYLWSKVYALDIVDEFKENGMANETLGLKLRDDIYSKGNTADGMTLLENFLGHEPGIDSLYSYIDLNVSNTTATA